MKDNIKNDVEEVFETIQSTMVDCKSQGDNSDYGGMQSKKRSKIFVSFKHNATMYN